MPAGNDSIAKATNQASLAGPPLPEASPPPDTDPPMKPEAASDPDSADRSAASVSLSPHQNPSEVPPQQQSQQQLHQAAAAQWVETDDLGLSKRQVASLPKHAMPNGVLPTAQGSMQHLQGSSQQPLSGHQQPQGSMEQPQGSTHAPQGRMQQLQGRLQQPVGGVHGAEGGADMMMAESQSDPQLKADEAGPIRQFEELVKQEAPEAAQVHAH